MPFGALLQTLNPSGSESGLCRFPCGAGPSPAPRLPTEYAMHRKRGRPMRRFPFRRGSSAQWSRPARNVSINTDPT